MERETIRDYLQKSDFTAVQADALSRLLSQTVTKEDLRLAVQEMEKSNLAIRSELWDVIHDTKAELQASIHGVEKDLRESIHGVDKNLRESIHGVEKSLQESIHRVEANMTRWMITLLVALGGLITLFNYFLD